MTVIGRAGTEAGRRVGWRDRLCPPPRRLGVPGGNKAPFGTRRVGRPSGLVVDEAELATVRAAYELAGAGSTDRRVADRLGLRLTHVHEILTNPFYAGRLWDGTPSALGPLVDPATWDRVQGLRSRYSRRHPGTVRRRHYALTGLLACAACGRRLTGHVGRIRHVEACRPFRAAAPRHRRSGSRNYDGRYRGESYPVEAYDGSIEAALERVGASAKLVADTVARSARGRPADRSAEFSLRRIARERDAAAERYVVDRDMSALQAAMARLDAEEQAARERPGPTVTAREVRRYLADLPRLWRETTPEGRRAIAEAAFDRIEALGLDLVLHPSAEAERYGWSEAFGSEPLVYSLGHSGRGERICPATTDMVLMRLAEPPEPCEWLRSA